MTSNITLENLHFSTIAHMTVLTTAIDRTIDSRTITGYSTACSCTTNIDDGLIDIAQEEVWYVFIAWRLSN